MNQGKRIKEQLHERFLTALEKAGPNWKRKVTDQFPEYDSRNGMNHLGYAQRSAKGYGDCSIEVLKDVTVALESVAGIEPEPIEV